VPGVGDRRDIEGVGDWREQLGDRELRDIREATPRIGVMRGEVRPPKTGDMLWPRADAAPSGTRGRRDGTALPGDLALADADVNRVEEDAIQPSRYPR